MSLGFAAIAENPIASGDDSLGLAVVEPNGIAATSAVGSVTVVPQGVFSVTGETATGAVGNADAFAEFIAEASGFGLVASLDEDSVISGSAPVSVTGQGATSALGSVTVDIISNVFPTGVEASGNIGDVVAPAAAQPTGVEGSSALGSVTVKIPVDVDVTGVEGTSALGSVTVKIPVDVDVTGVSGSTAVGSVVVVAEAVVELTGIASTGTIGTINVWGRIVPDQDPSWSETSPSQNPNWTEIAA